MTVQSFGADIEALYNKQKQYNPLRSSVDQIYNELLATTKSLAEKSERMLNAVAVVYGRNSSEYEMAGGNRRAERRRSRKSSYVHSTGEYARDEGGDGFCEVHANTMEGFWSLLRSWLRPHRGISQENTTSL